MFKLEYKIDEYLTNRSRL